MKKREDERLIGKKMPNFPLKVMHILTGGVQGGTEIHVLDLVKRLDKNRFKTILTLFYDGPIVEDAKKRGIEVRLLNKRFRGDLSVICKLIEIIRGDDIDILHTHLANGNLYGRLAALTKKKCRVVTTVHLWGKDSLVDIFRSSFLRTLIDKQDIWMSRFSDKIIALSEGIKKDLIKEGIRKDKITVIPNGIDLDSYNANSYDSQKIRNQLGLSFHETIIGTVGRLAPVKNIPLLLRSAKDIISQGTPAKFLIIGDGPLRNSLEQLVSDLGISRDVMFTGWQWDIKPIISILDIFVLCSSYETLPYALLEAMAMARPVIATSVGGNLDIVENNRSGILVPPADREALTKAILYLISRRDMANWMGKEGRQVIEKKYDIETTISKTTKMYQSLTLKND